MCSMVKCVSFVGASKEDVMSYKEFLDIAEKLRPWTEQAMKIDWRPGSETTWWIWTICTVT